MAIQSTNKKDRPHDPIRAAALEAIILIAQGEQTEFAVRTVTADKVLRPIDRRFLLQAITR